MSLSQIENKLLENTFWAALVRCLEKLVFRVGLNYHFLSD